VKKLILLMTMLTMTLTAATPVLAQAASSGSGSVSGDQSAQGSTAANSIRGTITSISGSVVLVIVPRRRVGFCQRRLYRDR
jgi:hypothetical protein